MRGVAHNNCNLNYRINPKKWKLPVVMHGLKNYDSHLLINALQRKDGRIRLIAHNMEKYLSFTINKLKFIDSFQFAGKSLECLANTLKDEEMRHTSAYFKNLNLFKLIRGKGVFFYDYLDKIERFDETKLPHPKHFHNLLNNTKCDPIDYRRAQMIWECGNCHNFGDYHDIYLKADVLILADFF